MTWLFLQSLSLYTVYLSFQTLFFERFIACFRIKGNVGFFIVTLDFIGYTGTVVVLVFKEFFNPDINWLDFYNLMSGYVGIVCSVASYARLSTWCSAIARRMLRDRWALPFSVCAVGPGRAIPCFLRLNNNNISYEKN